jgi:hypothetical protein
MMGLSGQLDERGAEKLAGRIGISYIVASAGAAAGGLAALIYAIRWW